MNNIEKQAIEHLNSLTKPIGSLGNLEEIVIKVAKIQNKPIPQINKKLTLVLAGDHDITEEGVSLYPQEVTYQMVENFVKGGAAINTLSNECNNDLLIVDAGLKKTYNHDSVLQFKATNGTANFLKQKALTEKQYDIAYKNGKEIAQIIINKNYDLVCLGDMGIGNTTPSAATIIASGIPSNEIIDRGTGISQDQLKHKKEVILQSIEKHKPFSNPKDILLKVGCLEFVTIKGILDFLSDKSVTIVLDGFPITSAAYISWLDNKSITNICFAGHLSKVKGHKIILDKMNLSPLVQLNMRLGEGTGAVIGSKIIDLAIKTNQYMATFNQAGVSKSEDDEENY